jgi:cell volume regulation protein A
MAYELFVLALTIVTGFAATILFERTRISQVIILMLFGFLLGPVFGILDVSEESIIKSILPFAASLALVLLLFDGGVEFDLFSVAKSIPRSMLFTFLVFIVGTAFASAALVVFLGWPVLSSVLLGTVAGGSSSAIVIAMAERSSASKETKSLLTVESTMTDALCIISAMVVVQLISANRAPAAGVVIGLLLSSFTTAIVVGMIAALAWIFAAERFSLKKYSYMLLIAVVFVAFTLAEEIGGNGGFAVFTFGIVLGNASKIGRFFRLELENPMTHVMRTFQGEITFFVRTFFFVYVGLLFSIQFFTPFSLAVSIGLVALFILARFVVQELLLTDLPMKDRKIIVAMGPRGLAAAVLASIPLTSGIAIPNFQELVFSIILFSNVAATIGVFAFDRDAINNGIPKKGRNG